MSLAITYLGHSGFVFDDGEHALAVDPFLTHNPLAKHKPADIRCDAIALTHAHADHLGDTVAIAQRTGAAVIAAFELAELLTERGVAKTEPGNPGGTIQLQFASVTFTQAFHSSSFEGRYMGQPCGLVIRIGGRTIYHAGDTGLFGDMRMIGEFFEPEVAILPIGDRYTMGVQQASRAAEWIGAAVMIPCHYNTWPPIAADPSNLDPLDVEVRAMKPGETWRVDAP